MTMKKLINEQHYRPCYLSATLCHGTLKMKQYAQKETRDTSKRKSVPIHEFSYNYTNDAYILHTEGVSAPFL